MLVRSLGIAACLTLTPAFAQSIENSIMGKWVLTHDAKGEPLNAEFEFSPDGGLVMHRGTETKHGTYQLDGTPTVGELTTKDVNGTNDPVPFHVYDGGLTLVFLPRDEPRALVLRRPEFFDSLESPGNHRTDASRTVFREQGLTGFWAADCTQPVGPLNPYTAFVIPDQGPPRVVIMGAPQVQTLYIDDAQLENGKRIYYRGHMTTNTWDGLSEATIEKDGDTIRTDRVHLVGISLVKGLYARGEHVDEVTVENGIAVHAHAPAQVRHRCGDLPPK